jgi:hypothetical protein
VRHERFPESGAPRRRRIDPEEINVLNKADDTEKMATYFSVLLRHPSVVGSE